MLFNSYEFFVFFPVVTVLYFLLPYRFRWAHLLVASCLFYCAFIPVYILILFFTIIIDYIAGILIEQAQGQRRKWYLVMSLVANIGVLAVFKYYNFLVGNFNWITDAFQLGITAKTLDIILPIGLSFHTFQAMSYTIEVYRGHQSAERNFGIYALYVMFYPQLVAGPIERPQNLLWQFRQQFDFDYARVVSGLRLMAWGLFKKVVIADRLAVLVNGVFDTPQAYTGLPLLMATVFFSLQIYCDFSGYSDIAIGAARVMGFKLMLNFDRPYASRTISEFWKRWHISLSTWFRDYLYISLGGNRVSKWRNYFNLFFVFLVSGLWHGASWNFVIWGGLHGFYLVFGQFTRSLRIRFNQVTGLSSVPVLISIADRLIVWLLVGVAWIFFRITTFSDARYVLANVFRWDGVDKAVNDLHVIASFYTSANELLIAFGAVVAMELVQYLHARRSVSVRLAEVSGYVRFVVYLALMLSIALFGMFGDAQFIYFQF